MSDYSSVPSYVRDQVRAALTNLAIQTAKNAYNSEVGHGLVESCADFASQKASYYSGVNINSEAVVDIADDCVNNTNNSGIKDPAPAKSNKKPDFNFSLSSFAINMPFEGGTLTGTISFTASLSSFSSLDNLKASITGGSVTWKSDSLQVSGGYNNHDQWNAQVNYSYNNINASYNVNQYGYNFNMGYSYGGYGVNVQGGNQGVLGTFTIVF